MTVPTRFFVADTGLLWNFAVIDRIDILAEFAKSTGKPPVWVAEISTEVKRNLPNYYSDFHSIFGTPLTPERSELADTQIVRRKHFALPGDNSTAHLGESESIAICSNRFKVDIVFMLTEDRAVRDFCKATRVAGTPANLFVQPTQWRGTVTRVLLEAAVSRQIIADRELDDYIQQLQQARRPLIQPDEG